MKYICLDLKYVWDDGENRFHYPLAIMDILSRKIIKWAFQRSSKQQDVIALMREIDLRHGLIGVIIRNDYGTQFIANKVRKVLQELEGK